MTENPPGQEPPAYPGSQPSELPPGQYYQGQQPYQGQPAYGAAPTPPQNPQWGGQILPKHPNAITAMVLGIVGLVSIAFCGGFLLILSPFAWAIGGKAVREIDANPTVYSGRNEANTGRICGIVGTILLVLFVLMLAFIIGLFTIGLTASETSSFTSLV